MKAAPKDSASADGAEHGNKLRHGSDTQPLHAAQIPDALLRLRTAAAVGGLSESTLYRKAASDPTFPKLVRIGTRCTRIRAGDFMAWLAAQAGAAE